MGRLKAAPAGVGARRPLLLWPTALLAALAWGCGGGFTVTPTSPSSPVPSALPITITFRGTLADGGSFEGRMTYGTRDQDERAGFGRFNGGNWDVTVKGGSLTHDFHFTEADGGRALIETYNTPFPAIGVIVLWPTEDPAQQGLTPHVTHPDAYNPDAQPKLRDFGTLIPGILDKSVGIFMDETGARTLVTSFSIQ
jgi:hypothetical protein